MSSAKILTFDVETAAALVKSWGLYNQNHGINQIVRNQYMLCYAAKWLGKKEIMFDSIFKYKKHFKADPTCDKKIAETLWKLLDEADIVVGHNAQYFDRRWANWLFVKHRLGPPSPYKVIDTMKAYKGVAYIMSYKLDNIARRLEFGHKVEHTGQPLWDACEAGDPKAWALMEKYNKMDVTLTEDVYLEIRPYMTNHPNLNIYDDNTAFKCNKCGSDKLVKNGYAYTANQKYQRYRCQGCGSNIKGASPITSKKQNTGVRGI